MEPLRDEVLKEVEALFDFMGIKATLMRHGTSIFADVEEHKNISATDTHVTFHYVKNMDKVKSYLWGINLPPVISDYMNVAVHPDVIEKYGYIHMEWDSKSYY